MGGKLSTIPENRATIVKPAYKKSANQWSNNYKPENRAPAAPACAPYAPNTCNTVAPKPSSGIAVGCDGGAGFPVKTTSTMDVIAFHSSTKWREYFEASKQSNKLVVIYFTATWCGPCRYMEPTIKELAAKYSDVDVAKLDVDELFNVSREFGIQAMPTFLLTKKGKEIDKVIGAKKEDLQKKVEKHRA
ncbi:Thioredoxin H2 [Bienertia sinuspersici]